MSCSGFPALNEHTSLQLTLLFPMFSFGSPMRLKVSGSHGLSPDCTAKDFYFKSHKGNSRRLAITGTFLSTEKLWFTYPTIACKTTHVEKHPGFS